MNKQKSFYDRKAKKVEICIGDRVLVKQLAFDGKHKIADRFEQEIYVVVDQPRSDIPVYKLKSEVSDKQRTLHHNHLLLIDHRDTNSEIKDEGEVAIQSKETVTRVDESKEDSSKAKSDVTSEDDEDSSDSEGDGYAVNAYWHGDAHSPKSVQNKVEESVDLVESMSYGEPEHSDKEDDKVTVETDVKSIIEDEDVEHVHGGEIEEVISDGESADLDSTGENIVNLDPPEDLMPEENSQKDSVTEEPVDAEIVEKQKTEEIDGEEFADIEEKQIAEAREIEKKPVPPPRPPRRSSREKKPPDRFVTFGQVISQMETSYPKTGACCQPVCSRGFRKRNLSVSSDQYPHITQIVARDVKQRKTLADNGYVIPRIPIMTTA